MPVERRLIVLKYIGRTPHLATCEKCHIKFFTALDLIGAPDGAQEYLSTKSQEHRYKAEVFSQISPK